MAAAEIRRTEWFGYGHYGFAAYRIWQRRDGHIWAQRHEWRREDGTVRMDDWIAGVSDWLPHATLVESEVA